MADSAMIKAPCCGRRKPVFAIRTTPDGFQCDSCVVEKVRVVMPILTALQDALTGGDWELVRLERTNRLTMTDQFDIERVRERINPEKLAVMDEYRQWLRDIPTNFTSATEALRAIQDRTIPS